MLSTADGEFKVPEFLSLVCSELLTLQKSGTMCDVFFTDEVTTVSAHSCVLAAVSPFMQRYILSRVAFDDSCKSIRVPVTLLTKMVKDSSDNCMECLSNIIGFIYTGEIFIRFDHFSHVLNFSCNLEINALISICQKYNSREECSRGKVAIFDDCFDEIDFEEDVSSECEKLVYRVSTLNKTRKESVSSKVCTRHVIVTDGDSNEVAICTLPVTDNVEDSCRTNPLKGALVTSDANETGFNDSDVKTSLETIDSGYRNVPGINAKITLKDKDLNVKKCTFSELSNEHISHGEDFCLKSDNAVIKNLNIVKPDLISKKLCNFLKNVTNVSLEAKEKANVLKEKKNESASHSNESQACLECFEKFDRLQLLEHHTSVFHSSKFNCLYCKFNDYSVENLIKHILKSKHGEKCSICLKQFMDNSKLLGHCSDVHCLPDPFICDICESRFSSRNLWRRHLIDHKTLHKNYKCETCYRFFPSRVQLKVHILKVHKNIEKICDICGYKTLYRSYLKRHMLKHDKKILFCNHPDCNFSSVWLSNLKNHLKLHNKKQKYFNCTFCEKSYSHNKNLQRHINMVHKSARVYNCPECSYSSKRLDKVKEHCRKHHTDCIYILDQLNKQSVADYACCESEDESRVLNDAHHEEFSSGQSHLLCHKMCPRGLNISNRADDCSERIVYLNEATGQLTFFCDSEGKAVTCVPDLITVHNLKSTDDNKSYRDSSSNSTRVILNEITGELMSFQFKLEAESKEKINKKSSYPDTKIPITVLDETTGEIMNKNEVVSVENDTNNTDFDNIFDTIDFDAMQDDSLDGFDDFDNALFDAEFSVGSASPDMDKILNEFTGELFTDDGACRDSLEKSFHSHIWDGSHKIQNDSNNKSSCETQNFSTVFLNEVTGELTAEFTSNVDS